MEDLNKTQIVLLAIFITFVTAAATGVVTVTLMDQTPPSVTQTVNRVVERTVEKVISPGKIEKTEVKQIVKEDDTIVQSIRTVRQTLVKIVRDGAGVIAAASGADPAMTSISGDSLALLGSLAQAEEGYVGFVVSNDGLVITTIDALGGANSSYAAVFPDDSKMAIKFLKSDEVHGISLFKIDTVGKEKITFATLNALSSSQVSLGQTVMALGLDSGLNTVSIGYISGYRAGTASSSPVIRTSIKPIENWSGKPIVDINGLLVAMYGKDNEIVPYTVIKSLIDSASVKSESIKTTP